MIIKNKKELATARQRKLVLDLIEFGIKSVLPDHIMRSKVKYDSRKKIISIENNRYRINGRIFVIGGGKASGLMAQSLEKIIPISHITAGAINSNSRQKTKKINIIKAGHPIPDNNGVKGVKQMLALKEKYQINKNDLLICLISGGGSALMPCPVKGVNLIDIQKTNKLLIESGAKIQEINSVRKHLSLIKGGRLAKHFFPAKIISIIISDVIGNDLDVIASGPTVPDRSTFTQAYQILKKHNLLLKVPKSVTKHLTAGKKGLIKDTPKYLTNCDNYIIADIKVALKVMFDHAKKLKLKPTIITSKQTGDPSTIARLRVKEILDGKYKKYNCGKGGRNQHYAAVTLNALKKYPKHWVLASVGTDGSDYLPNVAGAIVDNKSAMVLNEKKIDLKKYINQFDSYNLFKSIGNSIIKTGNTGTNVCDLMVYIINYS